MKIAFFCSPGPGDTFIKPIIEHFEKGHDIERFTGKTKDELEGLMNWSDVSFFEWCDPLVIHASQMPATCHKVCRLHSYEAFTDYPRHVNWDAIDDLIFVAPHIRDITLQQWPGIKGSVNIHIVSNGVDLDKYTFRGRKRGKNLAYIGYINSKKNPSLLLQCMRRLVDLGTGFKLHVAGKHQDLRLQLYWEHMVKALGLEGNIVFHGWIDDMDAWLEDKHFAVCTSYLESFNYGLAEAMSTGMKPLIHNFVGAEYLYAKKWLFSSVGDFVKQVLMDDYNPKEYRAYIELNYSREKQLEALEEIIL